MMVEEGRGAPHGVLLAVAVAVLSLLGDGGEALSQGISKALLGALLEALPEAISSTGLLLLSLALMLVIRFLSSDRGTASSDVFSFGTPDSIHRIGGSPIGVALVLLLLLLLLRYNRIPFFGGDDDSDEKQKL